MAQSPVPRAAPGSGRTRRILRAVAVVSCVPYLALKAARAGSGGVACWGGWLSPASVAGPADLADRPTQLRHRAYAGRMLVGLLVAAIGVHRFAERSAGAARRSA
ncbi:hypothetical protein ACFCXS_11915 [Streptomyces sp. NPDC056373]|uniref:hypothetical protein n=1 Tax=Streptomyces sp. NPDC056373 TaxID=3345798 RepID=UPI0035DE102C